MNRDSVSPGDAAAAPIDLAREAPFALGPVRVTPAALGLEARGWSQRLEPRAMQVLVVLARASPAVVGRGELNARVWGGRVVGDDAINRAVQMLRRVAAEAPPPVPFGIETIPRVGYRLTATQVTDVAPPPPARPADPPAVSRSRRGRWVAAAALAILTLVAAAAMWRARAGREPSPAGWVIAGARTLDDLPPGAGDVALSPDGERLAYRGRDDRGRERIFVRAIEGEGAGRAVSSPGVNARRPAWRADGAALAFVGYEPGMPCRLYVLRAGRAASPVGTCETARDPPLAWSADGRSLLFGDAPGWNAVPRISAVRIADGRRGVLSSPPGDSMGDDVPVPLGARIAFQRQFAWADEGWVARDIATDRERTLWRRRGMAGSAAAPLPGGALAIAWTRAGASGLDIVDAGGRVSSQPLALGTVTAVSAAGLRLLVASDRSESALARAGGGPQASGPLVSMRGRVFAPVPLPDGRLRFPVASAGVARIWDRDAAGSLRPWGTLVAARIVGLAPSPDGQWTAALVTGDEGREIVVLDAGGRPTYRWNPHARSLNPGAWSGDGRRLTVPVLDGAGWRLFALDPFGRAPPRDLGLPGFAVLQGRGPALYAVRAGETTGGRELWRLDGGARRLPIDLTLFDIVNWSVVDEGVWLPDRSARDAPRLVLRSATDGRVLRSVAAPGLSGPGSGLAADAHGPLYVKAGSDAPEYSLLTLSRTGGRRD